MPKETVAKSGVFKEWFDEAFYQDLAAQLVETCPSFDRVGFLSLALTGLNQRELMDRLRQTSAAAHASIPGSYLEQLKVLKRVVGPQANGLIGCWFSDFVGRYGLDHPEASLPALAFFTQFGSAEFAIREFLIKDQLATLRVMRTWADDSNEHIRRLASEGCRPRLPWGKRLNALVRDPRPTLSILEALRDDPSLYVRKSVANHLNDIAKDHPNLVLATVRRWDADSPRTAWIIKHGLRTLIKQDHPQALELLGVGQAAIVTDVSFTISPVKIHLGERIELCLTLTSTASLAQELLIDYIVHYVKASGRTSSKVFKWKQFTLAPAAVGELKKSQVIKDFSTRKHYSGTHRIEIQINGESMAEAKFELST